MTRRGMMYARPHELLPDTLRIINVRMNYLPVSAAFVSTLKNPSLGYIGRYVFGRDHHKLPCSRSEELGEMI